MGTEARLWTPSTVGNLQKAVRLRVAQSYEDYAREINARGAELVLAVNDAGLLGFRSLTSAMCLAQTLAMGLAFRDRRGGQTGALDDIDC